jgi:exonuclease SbcD
MDELFADYFRHKKGQEPNDEILNLFTEIMAEEDER